MWILLTGGAGFIGANVLVRLLEAGHHVVVVDDYRSGSKERVLDACLLARKLLGETCFVYSGNVGSEPFLRDVLFAHPHIEALVHLAASKSVRGSCADPLSYYENNVSNTIRMLRTIRHHALDCKHVLFSSTATVYAGHGETMPPPPFLEDQEAALRDMLSPYAASKRMVEQMLKHMVDAGQLRTAVVLRYFNPVGAHCSGKLGDEGMQDSDNLVPHIRDVLEQRRPVLQVYGQDYDESADGTAVRDYIHVQDVADAHVRALAYAAHSKDALYDVFNIGTGHGMSVLQVVEAVQRQTGRIVPLEMCPRREGDVSVLVADVRRARQVLGFQASHTVHNFL